MPFDSSARCRRGKTQVRKLLRLRHALGGRSSRQHGETSDPAARLFRLGLSLSVATRAGSGADAAAAGWNPVSTTRCGRPAASHLAAAVFRSAVVALSSVARLSRKQPGSLLNTAHSASTSALQPSRRCARRHARSPLRTRCVPGSSSAWVGPSAMNFFPLRQARLRPLHVDAPLRTLARSRSPSSDPNPSRMR